MKEIIFIGITILMIASAVMAVGFKSILYNAFSLMLTLFCVAVIFIYLNAEFIAAMEIIIYVGAIAIAIIFAVMFSPPLYLKQPYRNPIKIIRSICVASLVFIVLAKAILKTNWPTQEIIGDYSIQHLGHVLLHRYVIAFEVFSLIILLAMLGALMIARQRDDHA